MEEAIVALVFLGVFGFGTFVGSVNSTKDISSKQIIEANNLCSNSEGLYKINSGSKYPIAYCKNNDKFDLKENKS